MVTGLLYRVCVSACCTRVAALLMDTLELERGTLHTPHRTNTAALRTDVGVNDHLMAKLRTALALPATEEQGGCHMPNPESLAEAVEATAAKAVAVGINNVMLQLEKEEK
jgi:hypothetical protein